MHPTLINAAPAGTTAPEKDWSTVQAAQQDTSFVSKKDLPFVAWYQPVEDLGQPIKPLQVGDLCPKCQVGRLDYDGVLNLACDKCGYALSGGAGCT